MYNNQQIKFLSTLMNKRYLYHRCSIRLKGYDYSQPGLYFITIVTKNREHLFGEIKNGKMILNEAGKHTEKCWLEIPMHYPNTVLHAYIIMPNHIHGIIEIADSPVGANNHSPDYPSNNMGAYDYTPLRSPQSTPPSRFESPSRTIGSIIRGFKIGVTKWFREHFPDKYPKGTSIWQRNYWDHIIRDETEYNRIVRYIVNNPKNWKCDQLNAQYGGE